ncbi:MAG: hypothetical protein MJZ23_08115 [Paludibacteraceae bacterium]|nr:hypothetical protein [Paludibacteraceae bacterium]
MNIKHIFCLGMLFSGTLNSSAQSQWEQPNELNFGYGRATTTALFQSDIWDGLNLDGDTHISTNFSYSGAFTFSYLHQVANKVKVGFSFSYERTRLEKVFNGTEVPKYYYDRLEKETDPIIRENLQRRIDEMQNSIDYYKSQAGTSTKQHFTILPQLKLTYVNREHFAFYQRYGLGFDIQSRKDKDGNRNNSVGGNLCIVPVGIEFGGQYVRGIFECPAFSPQGLFYLGVKCDF